ncbi:BRO family protein, partial [Stutzerimonas stutzeri]
HNSVSNYKNNSGKCTINLSLGEALQVANFNGDLPNDPSGKAYQKRTTMFDEANTYQMLLRGHAPASEPFRKWVTEVVLPED